jgi:energy-coupling factor transport system permease protein
MYKDIAFGKYYEVSSFLHKINSTAKIISIIFLLISSLVINNIYLYILLHLFLIGLIIYSKIPMKMYYYSIKNVKYLIIFILIFNMLIRRIDITITLIIIFKITSLILISSLLTFTTKIKDINEGLENILSPLKKIKVPVNDIVLIISMAFRFIPTIFDQAHKILKSQACRGIDFKRGNLKEKITALSSMLIPMFILSYKRANAVAETMEVRFYDYTKNKTKYNQSKWQREDTIVVIISSFMLLLFIVSEVVFL